MKLQAINAIYRVENKKQVRVEPGKLFDCPDAEGEQYLAQKAARVPLEAKNPAAKPAKKQTAAQKKAAAAAEKKAADAAKDGDKSGSDDMLD